MSGTFEHYICAGGRRLRCGYTTGTCAALAAAGAVRLLLTGRAPASVSLETPKGLTVEVPLEDCRLEGGQAFCAVRKDGGDDADVTDGMLVYVCAERREEPGVSVEGGAGVGRVTRPGLDQPVGEAAINRVPRRMIREAVLAVCGELGYGGGLGVTVFVPEGERLAKRTFNPELGVLGGVSILGTSGIVEPMSLRALADTVALEIRQAAAQGGRHVILTPGNYGLAFLREQGLDSRGVPVIKCSNFIGEALDACAVNGFETVLLAGHIGKLVKLAGGIMNTHSRWADCRGELFCAHAAVCGASGPVCRALMDAASADGCIAILDEAGLREAVLGSMLSAAGKRLARRAAGAYRVGALWFSNEYGPLGRTEGTEEVIEAWK
ncbi:cobalt-precorrin-5B (C(1))-methyltransferase CbiD [Oscillospiraceae bacterium 38-13]